MQLNCEKLGGLRLGERAGGGSLCNNAGLRLGDERRDAQSIHITTLHQMTSIHQRLAASASSIFFMTNA
jgi:hypothetical protein